MPRRTAPDPLAREVGDRIRTIRKEEGMTIQELADESKIGSKGHISNVERGLVRPNVHTLKQVADGLGVLPVDLVNFPKKSVRQRLIDLTRKLSAKHIAELVRAAVAALKPSASLRMPRS